MQKGGDESSGEEEIVEQVRNLSDNAVFHFGPDETAVTLPRTL